MNALPFDPSSKDHVGDPLAIRAQVSGFQPGRWTFSRRAASEASSPCHKLTRLGPKNTDGRNSRTRHERD
jgi:hypothetical protein